MYFSRKIYYNDKPIILTTDKDAYINDNAAAETYSLFSGATLRSYTQAVLDIERPGIMGATIEDVSEDALLAQLYAMYTPIDAAGGVVYNEHGDILMIYRRGKWDLPKGKLDKGENIDECALREVREETGLGNLTLREKICDTYHIYAQHNEQLLKQTAWYKITGSSTDKLRPQKEENIIEARWVSEKDIAPFAAKTYEAIREVLKTAGLKWGNSVVYKS
ncbi:MAG: NUDIX hydrolase [Chitinophagales bacterium]